MSHQIRLLSDDKPAVDKNSTSTARQEGETDSVKTDAEQARHGTEKSPLGPVKEAEELIVNWNVRDIAIKGGKALVRGTFYGVALLHSVHGCHDADLLAPVQCVARP